MNRLVNVMKVCIMFNTSSNTELVRNEEGSSQPHNPSYCIYYLSGVETNFIHPKKKEKRKEKRHIFIKIVSRPPSKTHNSSP